MERNQLNFEFLGTKPVVKVHHRATDHHRTHERWHVRLQQFSMRLIKKKSIEIKNSTFRTEQKK